MYPKACSLYPWEYKVTAFQVFRRSAGMIEVYCAKPFWVRLYWPTLDPLQKKKSKSSCCNFSSQATIIVVAFVHWASMRENIVLNSTTGRIEDFAQCFLIEPTFTRRSFSLDYARIKFFQSAFEKVPSQWCSSKRGIAYWRWPGKAPSLLSGRTRWVGFQGARVITARIDRARRQYIRDWWSAFTIFCWDARTLDIVATGRRTV